MKVLVITSTHLDQAIAARGTEGTVASKDPIAFAAKDALKGETPVEVKDCGSFYVDTNIKNLSFAGGYTGEQAKTLRRLINDFGNNNFDAIRKSLPLTISLV